MLAFMVVLRSGHRFTIRAAQMRLNYDRCLELLGPDTDPNAPSQVVAMFDSNEVVAVIARENLVSEEPADASAGAVVVRRSSSALDLIPF